MPCAELNWLANEFEKQSRSFMIWRETHELNININPLTLSMRKLTTFIMTTLQMRKREFWTRLLETMVLSRTDIALHPQGNPTLVA
jgi:hypothetical protein